jgi:hypothetical protein
MTRLKLVIDSNAYCAVVIPTIVNNKVNTILKKD